MPQEHLKISLLVSLAPRTVPGSSYNQKVLLLFWWNEPVLLSNFTITCQKKTQQKEKKIGQSGLSLIWPTTKSDPFLYTVHCTLQKSAFAWQCPLMLELCTISPDRLFRPSTGSTRKHLWNNFINEDAGDLNMMKNVKNSWIGSKRKNHQF